MKKYFCLICIALISGCDKQADIQTGKPHPDMSRGTPAEVVDSKSSNNDITAREEAGRKAVEHRNRVFEERARRFCSEKGPASYVATRDKFWKLGEEGLIDYSNNPKYMEMVKTKDLDYRLSHHPNFIFDAQVFNVLRDAKKESPEVRFRIGYLVLLRLATHPREGVSLWDTEWKNIGPSGFIVHNALVLMGEASEENLEDRAEFSDELLDFAEKWIAEHPLPGK